MARDGTVSGGRPKGRRNNDTLEAEAMAKRLGVDPFEILLLMAKGDWQALGYDAKERVVSLNESGAVYDYTIPVAVRAKCAEKATEFLRPKLKALELTGDAAEAAALSLTQLLANAVAAKGKANAGDDGTNPGTDS